MITERFYYDKLSLTNQILYKKLYNAILKCDEYVMCGENDYTEDTFNIVLQAVLLDNSEVFHVKNRVDIEKTSWGLLKVYFKYFYTGDSQGELTKEIEKYRNELFECCNIDTEPEEKIIKIIHDFLIERTEIVDTEHASSEKSALVEALLENKMTTQRIAYTYKYLLNSADVRCKIIYMEDESDKKNIRLYNAVNLYGEERYIDIYEDAKKSINEKICYDYFGITENTMLENYKKIILLASEVGTKKDEANERMQSTNALKEELKNDVKTMLNNDSLNIEAVIQVMDNISKSVGSEEFTVIVEEIVQQLIVIRDIEVQYPDKKQELENGIMCHLADLIKIMYEYSRYKKNAACLDMISLLHEKLKKVVDILMKIMRHNVNVFWDNHMNAVMNEMRDVQQNLLDQKKNRDQCPIDIDSLDENNTVDEFVIALDYIKKIGFSQNITEQIVQIISGLKKVQQLLNENSEINISLEGLKNYYLPEVMRLMLLYDEYEDAGMNRQELSELSQNILISLETVNNALKLKIEEINKIKMMEVKARAKALAEILGQDGYVDSAYKITI